MKYLVLKSKNSINFFGFGGIGDFLIISAETNYDVPYYIRQHVSEHVNGMLTVNEVPNYAHGGNLFLLTHSGCNIYVDDKLIPQGVSVMEMGQKYVGSKFTMFLINEEEKSEVQADFDEKNQPDDHWRPSSPEITEGDDGYSDQEDWD